MVGKKVVNTTHTWTNESRRPGDALEILIMWLPNEMFITKLCRNLNRLNIKYALDVADKEIESAELTTQESRLQKLTADQQS